MYEAVMDGSTSLGALVDDSSINQPFMVAQHPQFPPLSQRALEPGAKLVSDNPADSLPLVKTSPVEDPETKIEKDSAPVMKDTDSLIKFGIIQSKHQKAIHNELKALLEYEKKILLQLFDRSTKFTEMKDENKKNLEEWEDEHSKRMGFYCQYLKELLDIPEHEMLSQEGVPGEVQQRILFRIVDNTVHVANVGMVQLTLQNALVNEVDLTLSKLKQYCTLMMKQIDKWMRMLSTQWAHQNRVLEQWETLNSTTKKLRELSGQAVEGVSAVNLKTLMDSVDSRLSKLENTVKEIKSQNILQGPPFPSEQKKENITQLPQPQVSPKQLLFTPKPEEVPKRAPSPGAPRTPFPTGDEYFGFPRTPPSSVPTQPEVPSTPVEGRLQRSRATPGQFPVDLLDVPGMGFPIPRAALEKGGRQRGVAPITPPPPQYGRFVPIAASSPVGSLREPQVYTPSQPTHPQMGQLMEPELLLKIQDDLQRLSRRNKHLQDLATHFKKLRCSLTDELDKAVRLNQKLQKDLYYVAQEAKNQPQHMP